MGGGWGRDNQQAPLLLCEPLKGWSQEVTSGEKL